jgi:hypothetical protein
MFGIIDIRPLSLSGDGQLDDFEREEVEARVEAEDNPGLPFCTSDDCNGGSLVQLADRGSPHFFRPADRTSWYLLCFKLGCLQIISVGKSKALGTENVILRKACCTFRVRAHR